MKTSKRQKTGFLGPPKILGILTSLLTFSCINPLFLAVSSAQEKPALHKLDKGVYAFIGAKGNANAGFILTDEGIIVVDSQMNEGLAKEMLAEIRKQSSSPILYVINTHYHGDHTFANHVFSPIRGIIAHENTLKFLQDHGAEHLQQFERFYGREQSKGIKITLPTQTLQDQLTLNFKDRTIQVLYLGLGHTNSDLVIYLPQEKILFSGDLVYVGRLPWLGDGNSRQWLKALEKLKILDFKVMVPGHGKVGDRQSVQRFGVYLTDLRAAVLTAMLHNASLDEMKQTIRLPAYQQDLKYSDWLSLNIEKVFQEMQEEK
jgi:glyoxylase-like metal-dependent hydrolase (beta-lactamase superfamily II)